MEDENEKILNLLETLQEYVQAQAELQSVMGDGYMGIADSRRKSTGLLISDLVLSPDQESRKLMGSFDKLAENPQKVRISGVSENCIRNVKSEFEKAIRIVLQLAVIKEQCMERYNKVKEFLDM